jgi:hypothetical protein
MIHSAPTKHKFHPSHSVTHITTNKDHCHPAYNVTHLTPNKQTCHPAHSVTNSAQPITPVKQLTVSPI